MNLYYPHPSHSIDTLSKLNQSAFDGKLIKKCFFFYKFKTMMNQISFLNRMDEYKNTFCI